MTRRLLAPSAVLLLLLLAPDAAAEERYAGSTLEQALHRLEETGLRIVFSDELVRPDMVVRIEPTGRRPRDVLAELLAPFGLEVRPGPSGVLSVVRTATRRSDPLRLSRREKVVVRARRPALDVGPGVGTTRIGRETLRLGPATFDDAIAPARRIPGIASDAATGALHVRGGRDDETMVVLDGLELYHPVHLRDRGGLVSLVDPSVVGDLTFLGGAFPAEFGGRMGGVLAIDSVDPADALGGEIAVGSGGSAALGQGGIADGRGRWLLSARRSDASRLLAALETDPAYRPALYDLFGRVDVALGDRTTATFDVLGGYDDLENPGEHGGVGGPTSPGLAGSRYTAAWAWATFRTDWSPGLFASTTVSAGRLASRRVGAALDLAGVDDRRATDVAGLKQDWTRTSARHRLKWGVDLRRVGARYDYRASEPVLLRVSGTDAAAYLSDRVRLGRGFEAELGLRWDAQSYTGPESSSVSPRLNLSRVVGRTTLRAGWGRFDQSQKIDELQVEDGVRTFAPPERSDQIVLDLEHVFPVAVTIRATAYSKKMWNLRPRFEDLFDPTGLFPEASADRVRVAAERGRARGLELSFVGREIRGVSGRVSYTWSIAEDREQGRWIARSWDQRHAVSAGVRVRPARGWSVELAGTWHSGRPRTPLTLRHATAADGSLDTVIEPGPRNSARLPGYTRLDARMVRDLVFRGTRLSLFVDVTNLLDTDNPCCIEGFDTAIPTTVPAELDPRYREGLSRLVTFGLRWSF